MSLLQSASQILPTAIEILAVVMVLIALGIISVGAIQQMIRFYQMQSLVLALLTILTACEQGEAGPTTRAFLIAFAVLIPGVLAYIIEPLLAQATVPVKVPWAERLWHPFLRHLSRRHRQVSSQAIREALPVWLEHGLSPTRQRGSTVVSLLLTAIAYGVAFNLIRADASRAQSLAVSMTLLMLGMFTMINRQDLISQIMGLLVMDHGLFMATVRVITQSSLIPTFVVSLFLYILITLVILVILLPELHSESATIEVVDQKELQG